jgi:Arc/MetJ-type ribon-helix-helix transcriptional regulator
MIICFDCPRQIKEALDALIESKQYKDYAEVISSAVSNLLALYEALEDKNSMMITEEDFDALAKLSVRAPSARNSKRVAVKHQVREIMPSKILIPGIFLRNGIGELPSTLPDLPADIWAAGQEIPLDRWIFGQYNKLLPAKASCRALAHLLTNRPEGVPLEETAQTIAEEAAIFGDYLRAYDERHGIGRDAALSTAFPSTDENREKSCVRYASQFVASMNTRGQISGLLYDLKLINRADEKDARIALTEAGWRFALIPNPVLDSQQERPTQKFSQEEMNFLIDHIKRRVPAEDFAYRTILTAINQGADTPEKIDTALQLKYLPAETGRSLSRAFLSSQRSGAISRMADLRLLTRVREDVRVSYKVIDIGKQYARSER